MKILVVTKSSLGKAVQIVQYQNCHRKIMKHIGSAHSEQKVELNKKLIEKTKNLLCVKGYYTNIKESILDNTTIIVRYHELYKIEQAFRIAKSDLQSRPIFHFKQDPIKLHILICFIAIVIAKHIELKASISIRKFIDESKKVVDGVLLNKVTNKTLIISAVV